MLPTASHSGLLVCVALLVILWMRLLFPFRSVCHHIPVPCTLLRTSWMLHWGTVWWAGLLVGLGLSDFTLAWYRFRTCYAAGTLRLGSGLVTMLSV